MKESSIPSRLVAAGVETAWEAVSASFERFCLTAGIATLTEMMQQDAVELCGARHARSSDRRRYRWGRTAGKLGFHDGKVAIERPGSVPAGMMPSCHCRVGRQPRPRIGWVAGR